MESEYTPLYNMLDEKGKYIPIISSSMHLQWFIEEDAHNHVGHLGLPERIHINPTVQAIHQVASRARAHDQSENSLKENINREYYKAANLPPDFIRFDNETIGTL